MGDRKLLRTGVIGTAIAAVCCFTPLLVVLVTGIGLSAIVGGLDYFLFPLLFASLGVVAFAFYMRAGSPGASPVSAIAIVAVGLTAMLFWLEFRYALRISLAAAAAVVAYGVYLSRRAGVPYLDLVR